MSTPSSYQAPLAKSEPQETLDQHTQAVIRAVSAMVEALRPVLPEDIPNLAIECARLLANQYLTSLSIGMLHALNNQGLVAQENNLYVVQCAYDSELGLQTDVPEVGSAWIV